MTAENSDDIRLMVKVAQRCAHLSNTEGHLHD